jgi:hypothetical protein
LSQQHPVPQQHPVSQQPVKILQQTPTSTAAPPQQPQPAKAIDALLAAAQATKSSASPSKSALAGLLAGSTTVSSTNLSSSSVAQAESVQINSLSNVSMSIGLPIASDDVEKRFETSLAAGNMYEVLKEVIYLHQSKTLFVLKWCSAAGLNKQKLLMDAVSKIDGFSRLCLLQRLGLLINPTEIAQLSEQVVGGILSFTSNVADVMIIKEDLKLDSVNEKKFVFQTCLDNLITTKNTTTSGQLTFSFQNTILSIQKIVVNINA